MARPDLWKRALPLHGWPAIGLAIVGCLLAYQWPLYAVVFVVGGLSATGDLVSRYRDEPMLAVLSLPGLAYLAMNGAVGLFTYHYFGSTPSESGDPTPVWADNPVLNAVAVGTGAMLILRSKLFTIRSEDGGETSFGPALLVEAILKALDREIDRRRASARHQLVFTSLNNIEVENLDGVVAYFQMSLLSFQNLSESEKAQLAAIVEEYRDYPDWSPALKTMAIGFAILTVAGENNFGQFIDGLKAYLATEKT